MYCKNCGSEIKDGDKYCFSCGQDIEEIVKTEEDTEVETEKADGNIGEVKIDKVIESNVNKVEKINNYLPLSIVAIVISVVLGLVFCNIFVMVVGLVFSVLGCVFANNVDDYLKKGNISEAVKNSKRAKVFSILGIAFSIGILALFTIGWILLMGGAMLLGNHY